MLVAAEIRFYRDVRAADVCGCQWHAVDVARAAVRADLELPEPWVVFFTPAHPRHPKAWAVGQPVRGLYAHGGPDDDTIRVRAGLSFDETLETALHELRHVDQHRRGHCEEWAAERREEDARQYATEVAGWLREQRDWSNAA